MFLIKAGNMYQQFLLEIERTNDEALITNVGDAQSVIYIHALMYMIHDKIYVGIDISIHLV